MLNEINTLALGSQTVLNLLSMKVLLAPSPSSAALRVCSLHQELLSWIYSCLKKADKDKDDKLSQSEIKNFMRLVNIEMDDLYTEMLFKVTPAGVEAILVLHGPTGSHQTLFFH